MPDKPTPEEMDLDLSKPGWCGAVCKESFRVAAKRALHAEHELAGLHATIKEVHAQHADDLCWMPADVNKIFAAAGLPSQDLRIGDKNAMLRNCERYVACLESGGPWKRYAELESELATAQARIRELEAIHGQR